MASYDAFIKQLTNPRYLRRDLKISDIKGPRVPNIGVPRVGFAKGTQPEVPEGTDMRNIYWDTRDVKVPKWKIKIKAKGQYVNKTADSLEEAIKIRDDLRNKLQPREAKKIDWENLDRNISSEIKRNNEEFKASRIPELARRYGIDNVSLHNRINDEKITAPLSSEQLVKNYIEYGLQTNKPVKDFVIKNITKHVNSSIGESYKNDISEETISKVMKENYPKLYNSTVDKKYSNFLHRNTDLLKTPINEWQKDPETVKENRTTENYYQQRGRAPFRNENYAFNLTSKDNRLLNYFDIAHKKFGKEQFVPVRTNEGKLIGYKDTSEEGKGKTYYAAEYKGDLDPKTEALITEHPDNEKVQKYVKAQSEYKGRPLDENVQKVFTERGYKAPTADKLLRYFIQKGPSTTDYNPVVIAHNEQVENKAANVSLLDYIKNLEEKDARRELNKIKDPLAKKIAIQAIDEDFKRKGIKSSYEGKPLGITEDIDPYKQISDYDKYVNRKIFQHIVGFQDEEGNVRNLDTMMKDIESMGKAKPAPVEKKSTFSEELFREFPTKEGKEEIEMLRKHKEQFGPDILKSGSGARTALKMVPGAGQAATAAFIPYDFATALLGGYSLPEATAFAGLNVLPPTVQKAIPALMPGFEQAMGEQEDKVKLANERREALEQGITNIKNKLTGKSIDNDLPNYSEGEVQMKKGGRVGLKQGGEPTGMYYQEIPDVDPEIILHKQIINEDDPVRIAALEHRLDMYRKQLAQEEKQRQEYKQAQKDQGVRYLEDFPTQSDYFKEMGKELASATGMPYLAAKFTKGVIELPEWVVGQTYTTGKALAGQGEHKFYHPVAGEKIGLDKAIKQLEPERPTTGILNLGTTAELAGGFTDPLLIPRLGSKTVKGIGSLVSDVESGTKGVVDTSRRDLLKTGAVIAAAPVLSKFSKVKTPPRVAEAIETGVKVLPKVSGMPEWFPSLISKIEKEGKFPTKDYATVDNVRIKELTVPTKNGNEVFIMTEYPSGKIEVQANIKGGAYDQPFELHYTPPKTDIHVETGEPVKYPGEFSVVEQRPRPDPSDPGRWEFDWEDVSREQALSDIDKVEQFTTGKIADPKAAEKRAAQRKSYDNTPYEDIADRYPEPNIPDYWE